MNTQFQNYMEQMTQSWSEFPWEDQTAYANYLAQTYYYVRHSCRLLAFAAGLADLESEPYFKRSIKHISEESNHEQLAETDLKRLGEQLSDYPELGITKSFYESQYYKIQNINPTVLLGYILALEGAAVIAVPKIFPRLKDTYNPKSLNFLRVHAEEDPEHLEHAFEQIEALPNELQQQVWENFRQTCEVFSLILSQSSNKQLLTSAA